MQKNKQRLYLFYLLLAPTVAIITVVLRTLALLTKLEDATGFYTAPTLPTVTAVLLLAITAAMAIFTYETRAQLSFRRDYRDLPTLFSGVFLAIVLVFFGITMLADLPSSPLVNTQESSLLKLLPFLIAAVLPALTALIGSLLFVLRAFDGAAEGTTKAMLSLPLAAFGIFFALYLSMDGSILLNAPIKLLGITAWIIAAFFFLGVARIALGRAKWALHSFFTEITVIFTATLSIPNLIYQATTGAPLLGNTAHDFVALGVCLYSLARLCATVLFALRETAPDTSCITCADAKNAEEANDDEEPKDEEATDR